MAFGLDYSAGMPPTADMKVAGVSFVCRYIGYTDPSLSQIKILTPEEADVLSHAGIALVSNWEWYVNRVLEGYAAGVWDAQEAQKRHANCGGPPNRPIYFSVDEDYSASQVLDYFHGVSSVIGLSRTGAYGSYRVIAGLFDLEAIAWGWQTYAWSGSQWEPRAHIQQYNNGVTMSGLSVDYDRSIKSDFGQWFPGGTTMTLPNGWHDDGKTLTGPNGVPIVLGFRNFVLPLLQSGHWDAGNAAMGPQFYTPLLEASNPALGDGDQIIFRDGDVLGYPHNPQGVYAPMKDKVIREWGGQELIFCRQQVQKYAAQRSLDLAQIAQLQAELAKATATTGLDPTLVKDRLTAIGLAASNGNTAIQQLVTQPL